MEEYVKLNEVLKMLCDDFEKFDGKSHLLLAIQHMLELPVVKLNVDKNEELDYVF